MASLLTLRVKSREADAISDRVWAEAGVLGVQEAPLGEATLFAVARDFEILEFGSEAARRCGEWLENESFREGNEMKLLVYLDCAGDLDAKGFAERVCAGDGAFEAFEELETADYLEQYRKAERGTAFAGDLWIGPPWAEAPAGHQAFVVEPGLAFGTGGHPTTQLCFERLRALAREGAKLQRVLDLGTGTGILGVAVRTFHPRAELLLADLDPLCDAEVEKTFVANKLPVPAGYYGPAGTAEALAREGLHFDSVVSNIYAEVLAAILPAVARVLESGGRWVVSGILRGEAETVLLERAAAAGFTVVWSAERAVEHSQLDKTGGLRAIQEIWAAYEFRAPA